MNALNPKQIIVFLLMLLVTAVLSVIALFMPMRVRNGVGQSSNLQRPLVLNGHHGGLCRSASRANVERRPRTPQYAPDVGLITLPMQP